MPSRAVLLHDRLIRFGATASRLSRRIGRDPAGQNLADQLARSATGAAAHYGEACEAESRADFIHKLSRCSKELREAHGWLKTAILDGSGDADFETAEREGNELISIIVASLRTAKGRSGRRIPNPKSPTPNPKSQIPNP